MASAQDREELLKLVKLTGLQLDEGLTQAILDLSVDCGAKPRDVANLIHSILQGATKPSAKPQPSQAAR